MQQPDDSYSITQEQLVQYVFKQLTPEEEAQVEDFLDANPHEADIVDGILQFCEEKGIHTRAAFDKAWSEEMTGRRDKFEQNATSLTSSSPASNKWKWVTFALLLLAIGGGGWLFRKMNQEHEHLKVERYKVFQKDSAINNLQNEINALRTGLNGISVPPNTPEDSALQVQVKQLKEELIQKEATLIQMQSSLNPKNREIAMKYAPKKKQTRSIQETTSGNVFEAADRAYDSGNYEASIRLLQGIPKGESYDRVIQRLPFVFFYGQRFKEANEAFVELAENDHNKIMEVQYFLLLCNLAEGRFLEARLMRATILSNPKHPYFREANTLPEAIFQR